MAAGLSREQFNAMARRRLQQIARETGGLYCRGHVLFDDGVYLQFRRINASNGEAAGILQAVNDRTNKAAEGLPVLKLLEEVRAA